MTYPPAPSNIGKRHAAKTPSGNRFYFIWLIPATIWTIVWTGSIIADKFRIEARLLSRRSLVVQNPKVSSRRSQAGTTLASRSRRVGKFKRESLLFC